MAKPWRMCLIRFELALPRSLNQPGLNERLFHSAQFDGRLAFLGITNLLAQQVPVVGKDSAPLLAARYIHVELPPVNSRTDGELATTNTSCTV